MSINDVKIEYMDKAELAFDDAVSRLRSLYSEHPEDVNDMIEFWDEITWDMTYLPEGKMVPPELLYGRSEDILDALWFIGFFISHELYDDGEPALVYLGKDLTGIPGLKELLDKKKPEAMSEVMTARRELLDNIPWLGVPIGTPNSYPVLLRTKDPYSTKIFEVEYPDAISLHNMDSLKIAAEYIRAKNIASYEKLRVLQKRNSIDPKDPSIAKRNLKSIMESIVAEK